MQTQIIPPEQILTQRKFLLRSSTCHDDTLCPAYDDDTLCPAYDDDTLCPAYDQDITYSKPRTTESHNGSSLFNDPITISVDQILKNPCTEQITAQALEAIQPGITTKTYHDDTLHSACDQDITYSMPRTTESHNGSSLFNDPITISVDQILKNPCTKQITAQALEAIQPGITTKTYKEYLACKLTIPQKFALNTLLEHVLRRCDNIIRNPQFNLLQSHTNSEPLKQMIMLRRFQDFPPQSTELFFLKAYAYFSKFQNKFCLFPRTFDIEKYIKTTEFDRFFESPKNISEKDDDELRKVKNSLRLYFSTRIQKLANLADQLESKQKSQNVTEEPILKKHRTEN